MNVYICFEYDHRDNSEVLLRVFAREPDAVAWRNRSLADRRYEEMEVEE